MPVFYINSINIKNGTLIISGELLNHIKNSLRCKVNDSIRVIDENRISYKTRIFRITKHSLEATIIQHEVLPPPSSPPLILAPALVKKNKMDALLEKAAEFGVSEIIPLITKRTIIHPNQERWDHQKSRWQKILLEASQQSEQSAPPNIQQPINLISFLNRPYSNTRFIFLENETVSLKKIFSSRPPVDPNDPITLIIGPEGGFEQNEIDLSIEKGYISVSLGRHKFRSETAVMAALTLIQYELGYFGQ